jgi:hypothetical protein
MSVLFYILRVPFLGNKFSPKLGIINYNSNSSILPDSFSTNVTNVAAKQLALLRIRKVPVSNFGPETDYPGFSVVFLSALQDNARIVS